MASVHLPGMMSKAEYLRTYNWMEPDSVTREPMMRYKSKGQQPPMYSPMQKYGAVIYNSYEEKDERHIHRPEVHVDQEPSFRFIGNDPKVFLSSW